jgi:hypothetical protein
VLRTGPRPARSYGSTAIIQQKYRSLDRFYLETDFSKGHLSGILRGKGITATAALVVQGVEAAA